jgi:hypothetical protein
MLKPRGTPSREGQDLVPEMGVRHAPGAIRGVGTVVDGEGDTDGEGAGVPWVGGREGHAGRVGAVQGASLERLDDEAAPVDYLGFDVPGK